MSSRLTQLQIERMSGEELLARGLATRGGGNVLIVPEDVYQAEAVRAIGADPPWVPTMAEVPGSLYVLRALPSTPAKIGFTRAERVEFRLLSLQTGNPYPLKVVARATCLPAQEREAHQLLADHRLTGEWFDWSPRVEAFAAALSEGIETALACLQRKITP